MSYGQVIRSLCLKFCFQGIYPVFLVQPLSFLYIIYELHVVITWSRWAYTVYQIGVLCLPTLLRDYAVPRLSAVCFVVNIFFRRWHWAKISLLLLRAGFPVKMKYFSAVQRLHFIDVVLWELLFSIISHEMQCSWYCHTKIPLHI